MGITASFTGLGARMAAVAGAFVALMAGGVAAEVKVSLIEAGAEPRTVLAFKPVKDSTQFSRLTINNKMHVESGPEHKRDMDSPTLNLEMGSVVKDVSADGMIKLEETLHRAGASQAAGSDPNTLRMIADTYRQLEGLKTTADVKPNGEKTESVQGRNPLGVGGLGDMTSSLAVVFPAEAIGPGGKWQVENAVGQQGLRLDITYTFELVKAEGDKVELKVGIEGSAPTQTLDLPNLPPGAQAELTKATMNGSGSVELDLTKLYPLKAAQLIVNDTQMKLGKSGSSEESVMIQRIEMSLATEEIGELSPKAAPAPKPRAAQPTGANTRPRAKAKPKVGAAPQ